MKKVIPSFILLILILCACSPSSYSYSDDFFAMDTYMTLTANGVDAEIAVKKAEKEVQRLEGLLSAHDKKSEVYKLNKKGSGKLSDDTLAVLKKAIEYNKLTNGTLNPTMLQITELWGFPSGNYRVPEKSEISNALNLARPDKISIKNNEVEFKTDGIKVDLGAIAKGYTSSKIVEIFKKNGIESGIINLGGNVQTLGTKPDGSLWTVAIENPDEGGDYLGALKVKDKAVVTSGGYERNFTKGGKTYHHILNPENGYPAESGLSSVTVVCDDGTLSDALSTSLFVMGKNKAVKFYKESDKDFDIILYTNDGKLYVSQGIADNFNSQLNFEIIKKD